MVFLLTGQPLFIDPPSPQDASLEVVGGNVEEEARSMEGVVVVGTAGEAGAGAGAGANGDGHVVSKKSGAGAWQFGYGNEHDGYHMSQQAEAGARASADKLV